MSKRIKRLGLTLNLDVRSPLFSVRQCWHLHILLERGCIELGFLKICINFFKWMTFKEFDIFLKTFINFCRVCKFMDDFHRLL